MPGKATSRRWLLQCVWVGIACLVVMAACSEQKHRRILMALFDGVPEEEGAAGEGRPADSEAGAAGAGDRQIAAAPAEDEPADSFKGISANHADFATDCGACHGPSKLVTDDLCQECHGVGLHQDEEMDATCASCHLEHRGLGADLTQARVELCTDCHDQHPFEDEHPEFSLVTDADAARQAKYAAGLEVFHSTHAEDMECNECHQSAGGREPAFKPVTFDDACATCHELDEHQTVPDTSWADLRARLPQGDAAEAVLLADARWQQRIEGLQGRPELAVLEEVRQALADDGLEECLRCHSFVSQEADGKQTLAMAPVRYRTSWFRLVRFSHGDHADMDCDDCHSVPEDRAHELGRLMLPGQEICADCHNQDGASSACSTCHLFHDR